MTRAVAKTLSRMTPRGVMMASVALFGVAIQIGWLIMLAQGAAAFTDWLF